MERSGTNAWYFKEANYSKKFKIQGISSNQKLVSTQTQGLAFLDIIRKISIFKL